VVRSAPASFLHTFRCFLQYAGRCDVRTGCAVTLSNVLSIQYYMHLSITTVQSLTRGVPFVFEVLKDKGDTFCKLVATTEALPQYSTLAVATRTEGRAVTLQR